MKLLATIYTTESLQQLVTNICPDNWQVQCIDGAEYKVQGEQINITFEGEETVLLHGECHLDIDEIDRWVKVFSQHCYSFQLDVHGDAARLIRRYQQ